MNKEDIRRFVSENPDLVTYRQSKSHPDLYVLKYKKKVFFDNLWNNELEYCRGTVVDASCRGSDLQIQIIDGSMYMVES